MRARISGGILLIGSSVFFKTQIRWRTSKKSRSIDIQIIQRRPVHIPRLSRKYSLLARLQGRTESERTDSKVHSSRGNKPTLSQSALSSAINRSGDPFWCVQITGAWGGVKLDIAGSSFLRGKIGVIEVSDRMSRIRGCIIILVHQGLRDRTSRLLGVETERGRMDCWVNDR